MPKPFANNMKLPKKRKWISYAHEWYCAAVAFCVFFHLAILWWLVLLMHFDTIFSDTQMENVIFYFKFIYDYSIDEDRMRNRYNMVTKTKNTHLNICNIFIYSKNVNDFLPVYFIHKFIHTKFTVQI